jgi:hypothetical protein
VRQEEEALKIWPSEEGDGPSLTLPTVEEGGGPSMTLLAVEEGGWTKLDLADC